MRLQSKVSIRLHQFCMQGQGPLKGRADVPYRRGACAAQITLAKSCWAVDGSEISFCGVVGLP